MWKVLRIRGHQNFSCIYQRLSRSVLEQQVFIHPGDLFELHYKRAVGRPKFRQVY